MCLSKVTKVGGVRSGYGYKVFREGFGELFPQVQGNGKPLKVGVWLDEMGFRFPDGGGIYGYNFGWHIFKKKKDARDWRCFIYNRPIYKVQYRKAHTKGLQGSSITVVAKEMKILSKLNE